MSEFFSSGMSGCFHWEVLYIWGVLLCGECFLFVGRRRFSLGRAFYWGGVFFFKGGGGGTQFVHGRSRMILGASLAGCYFGAGELLIRECFFFGMLFIL